MMSQKNKNKQRASALVSQSVSSEEKNPGPGGGKPAYWRVLTKTILLDCLTCAPHYKYLLSNETILIAMRIIISITEVLKPVYFQRIVNTVR